MQRELQVEQAARAEAAASVDASSRISGSSRSPTDGAGSTQAESPEWTPARSTCSTIAATQPSSPSQSTSTSSSSAPSRKRSTSAGPSSSSSSGPRATRMPAAAEHVRGPDEHRVAGARRERARLGRRRACVQAGARRPSSASSAPKRPRSSARSIARAGRRAAARPLGEAGGEPERRLAAERDDDAERALERDDVEHALERDRLEVEAVAGVVVGRDRLRVRVDEHDLVAEPAEGLRGADAAVVELDPLADPVRPRAEHDDRAGARLVAVALLVREVVVRRPRLELAGAGVDREPAGEAAAGAHLRLRRRRAARRCGRRGGRSASPRRRRRPRRARSAAAIEASSSAKYGCRPGISGSASPASTPSSAFSSASGSVRPIPSASPTARISVPSARALPGNFSKSKRGALTAT